jgi:hypothetical protein
MRVSLSFDTLCDGIDAALDNVTSTLLGEDGADVGGHVDALGRPTFGSLLVAFQVASGQT